MKHLLFIFFLSILGSCKDHSGNPNQPEQETSFEYMGLEGKIINRLIDTDSKLIAATDQGLYVSDFSDNWALLGLSQKNVIAIAILDSSTIICSVLNNDQYSSPELYKSDDFGNTWSLVHNNFGGDTPEVIFNLKYDEDSKELFATGLGVIAHSFDEGKTWEVLFGLWQMFSKGLWALDINPLNNDVWAGGQGAVENQVFIQINLDNNISNQWSNEISSPSTVEKFAFNSSNPNQILLGCEDGILYTENNGLSWKNIYSTGEKIARFYFGITFDPYNSNKIIAASWDKNYENPQPLMLHVSENEGESWDIISPNISGIFGGTRDLLLKQENGKTVLYLGLYKGGVYKVML